MGRKLITNLTKRNQMDIKLLLCKAIVLLYRESLLPGKTENSNDIVRTALEGVKFSDINIDLNQEKKTLIALKQTTIEMCDNPIDHIYEKEELLHRLKMNCGEDEKLYDLFFQGIDPDLTDGPLKRTVINIRKSIHNHFREQKVEEILSKAAMEFKYRREKIKNVNQDIRNLLFSARFRLLCEISVLLYHLILSALSD